MDSAELNKRIHDIENSEKFAGKVKGLEVACKSLPYIGWFWRDVDFDAPIRLGILPAGSEFGESYNGWTGFMENNKWGYDEFLCTKEQSAEIRRLLELAATKPTAKKLQAVFDYIQTCKPKVKSDV